MSDDRRLRAVVIGGGPAGLTAAYLLVRRNADVIVVERDAQVGGLARTVEYKGFRFDIGGHRFFTKVGPVRALWRAMLGPDMLTRPRLSRIYYRGRFFDYPLKPLNVLRGLGPLESLRVILSYLRVRIRPIRPEVSVEDWVSNRFGRRLFRLFFKTYTEKVWGIPCNQIGAQWAAQRIKGLSLVTAVTNMLFRRRGGRAIKTLIDEFEYPRLGPGMMWEAFRADIEKRGASVLLSTRVVRLHHDGSRVTTVEVERDGRAAALPADLVLSTMPLRELVESLSPAAPPEVRAAAAALKYRDFLTVALILDVADLFPDNWIYVHDPRARLGRIQNFKNWSPDMVPDPRRTCLGLEYFCFEGDDLWTMADEELVALGARELDMIGLLRGARVLDGTVVRMPKAYPVYDEGYEQALAVVRRYLERFANLQVAGRNGMHKYNNQDHSMVTAILAVQNFFGARHDVWAVNADDEYHEEDQLAVGSPLGDLEMLDATQPLVPRPLPASTGRGA
ncbi:MAG TPA: NAD(P)/FAD-dependent oxidoreductase [Vicinamibacterales bacterium]|nr:NAD(P)/FAD-dependent oxidoreductase [Vicinamibacterales bacterium]